MAFINRIRSLNYRIASSNYDLYAMNAEIEAFCERQVLSKKSRQNLLLENEGEEMNLLDKSRLPDELGLNIINHLAEWTRYRRVDDKNRITVSLKKD